MESLYTNFASFLRRISFVVLTSLFLIPSFAHAAGPVDIWWPTDGARVSGMQPVKALYSGKNLSEYTMYWSVDGGQQNLMPDSYQDYPHKETSIDVSGWRWRGNGPYVITLTAKDKSNAVIGARTTSITIDRPTTTTTVTTTPAPVPAPTPTPTTQVTVTKTGAAPGGTAPVPTLAPTAPTLTLAPVSTGATVSDSGLYVDFNSPAAKQALTWSTTRPADAAIMKKVASTPSAAWFGGWNQNVQADAAALVGKATAAGKTAVLIAYNIPGRDCGSYSAGGANGSNAYRTWIRSLAAGIGGGKAIVVLEPDATAGIDCLSTEGKAARNALLSDAIGVLKANANTKVYLDGGNAHWIAADVMASRLTQAGIAKADGFSLNVSNFFTTAESNEYGKNVSSRIGGKSFVVDTSRNGSGSNGQWCNPDGRSLGQTPTFSTGVAEAAAYLWLKTPGESDGSCNGNPSAGNWMPEYALGLAKRAGY
ncbi:MAG: glycoside hydrolase family 6 protein [Patescibacteria group bacterium]